MDCHINKTFISIQNSSLALITGLSIHKSQLMRNLMNPPKQYSKYQLFVCFVLFYFDISFQISNSLISL